MLCPEQEALAGSVANMGRILVPVADATCPPDFRCLLFAPSRFRLWSPERRCSSSRTLPLQKMGFFYRS